MKNNIKRNCNIRFSTPKELEELFDSYIEYCSENKKYVTKTGFCWWANMGKDLLHKYAKAEELDHLKTISEEERKEFQNVARKILAYIEMSYEQMLFNKNTVVGAIFTLKNNYGWKDKVEVENINKNIKVELTE